MAKRDPIRSAKIKEYAKATGTVLRTAQRHANEPKHKNHPDWLNFSGEKKSGISVSGQVTSEAALPVMAPNVDGSEEGQMLSEIWNLWVTTKADRDDPESDPAVRVVLAKAMIDIRKDFEKAKADYESAKRDREQSIDYSDFEVVHQQFAVPVANLFKEMPSQLARDEDDRQRLKTWVSEKAQPVINSWIEALAGKAVAA